MFDTTNCDITGLAEWQSVALLILGILYSAKCGNFYVGIVFLQLFENMLFSAIRFQLSRFKIGYIYN